MIRTIKPAARRSSRSSIWRRAFVIRRRFHCQRRGATVIVWFDHVERRRQWCGGPWIYRTLEQA